MGSIVKSNIEAVRRENGLTRKDIDVFANNLAESFKGYPLFEYFADNKYDVRKMRKFWKVSLKTMPEFRGRGLGSKIMRPMLDYLDEHRQDCYLETLLPVNVGIYQKYGFELK